MNIAGFFLKYVPKSKHWIVEELLEYTERE